MTVLFASSHSIDFGKLSGTVNAIVPGQFDANYVKQTLQGGAPTPCWRHDLPAAAGADFFYQFKQMATSVASGVAGRLCFGLYNFTTGVETAVVKLRYVGPFLAGGNADYAFEYWNGSAYVQLGGLVGLTNNVLYQFTVQFKIHGSAGILSFWVNNVLIGQITGNTAFLLAVTYAQYMNPSPGSGASGLHHWAEIFVTVGENPNLMKVKTHVLTAAGATSDWTGAYTDIDEADPSSADLISAATAGLVSTFTADDLPALGALVVRAVQVSALARCGATGPQNINLVLRASGVDQLSPTKALTTGFDRVSHLFASNSVTSSEFTAAEVNASEPGVKSVT